MGGRAWVIVTAAGIAVACGTNGADTGLPATPEPDPRAVLQARIDHGAGSSVFDDGLWSDSSVAAALLTLAPGAPRDRAAELTGLAPTRIQTLLDRGYLRTRGDSLSTSFPVVSGVRSERYYDLVRSAAAEVLRVHRTDVDDLLGELDTLGLRLYGYHALWSLVFDGQRAWVEMVDEGVVPAIDRVRSWVVHPAHPYKTGTNVYGPGTDGEHLMPVSWRPNSATIQTAESEWEGAYEALLERGTLPAELSIDRRAPAPGLVLSAHPRLAAMVSGLSGTLHRTIRSALDVEGLAALFHGDTAVAFAAAYHDVGWEVIGELVDAGALAVPPALGGTVPGTLDGAASLVPLDTAFMRIIGAG